MTLTNEDLLAISQLLDVKLQPIKEDINFLRMQNENDVLPRLQNIESCYTSTYNRYQSGITQLDAVETDLEIIKKMITEHSKRLEQLA